jgi:FtsP/CotA-like multicopper oxidase with cupredoxin domain
MAMKVSRRTLLRAAGVGALGAALGSRPAHAAGGEVKERRLKVKPGVANLTGDGNPNTPVWAYDGTVPGPGIRVRQGEPVRIIVSNGLDEATTVHWHGIRVPNAMDGVPGLTQPAIRPGESFAYEFTPPDAGTFWYHPHVDGLVQMGRGLAGALIVEEREPPPVDRELVWVVQDWRLDDDAQLASGFGNRMEAAMAGRIGNTVTINGRVPDVVRVRAGERVRLRIINAATARIMALAFEKHSPVVVALDGQPCEPHPLPKGRLLLGPAMRADVILDMTGAPGRRYAITDDFYGDRLADRLVDLTYDMAPPLRAHPIDATLRLPANPLPEPNLAAAERHEIVLQGGMMGGAGMMGMGSAAWAINGASMTGDGESGMPPMLTLRRGATCVLTFKNETAWWHPMHLHGHTFRLLSPSGVAGNGAIWGDTVLVPPRERVSVAFVADNPGDWMLHCHVMDHQVAGLMTVLRVA